MAAAYLRTFFTTQLNPGLVPLSSREQTEREAAEKLRKRRHKRSRDDEESAYVPPDTNPDSPGLEAFYSKDVFVCEVDGRPKWCSECQQWKPDRSHHSSDLGRCVRKMDHFCPWVGGIVSETCKFCKNFPSLQPNETKQKIIKENCVFNNLFRFVSFEIFTAFNFFTQFCLYTGLFSAVNLAVGAYSFHQHHQDGDPADGWAIAAIVLACVFGTFTFGMALTSIRFIFLNTTNVDMLKRSNVVVLAVRIPSSTPSSIKYPVIVYPLRGTPHRPGSEGQQPSSQYGTVSVRDQQAERKFAILRTKPRENPWDLGIKENWKAVMGDNIIEWLLPIRHSPCCNHESMESDYKLGPLISRIRRRYGAPELETPTRNGHAIELQDRTSRRASD